MGFPFGGIRFQVKREQNRELLGVSVAFKQVVDGAFPDL